MIPALFTRSQAIGGRIGGSRFTRRRNATPMTMLRALALAAALPPLAAGAMPDPGSPCAAAAAAAAAATGVPFAVLLALAQTETGRGAGGEAEPWPWAVNDSGESHYFATRAAARDHAEAALAAGRRSFDLGCFQLNYRWHGQDFASPDAMLDPAANALHAARFLADLHAESGDWSVAAGAYHSRTAELADAYRSRFDRFLVAAQAAPEPPPAPGNAFPLLRPGQGARALASLVPLDL